MLLEQRNLQKRTLNALNKKKLYTTDDILRFIPYKYHDYSRIMPLGDALDKDCAISGYVESIGKNERKIEASIIEETSGEKINVFWFGHAYEWEHLKKTALNQVIIGGKITKHPQSSYTVINPVTFCLKDNFIPCIIPVYHRIKGVSEDMLKGLIKQELSSAAEPLENIVVDKSGLMDYKDALKELHFPSSLNKVEQAKKRLIFNDILYFSMKMKNVPSADQANSMFTISVSEKTKEFILKLPEITGISDFSLTKDQLAAVNAIASDMKKGLRANYLIQGDVSCGKTIIAVISMFLMAENGYQSVIMVPTTILAKQHYIELKNYADIFGYKTALLSSELKQRQKKDILKGIENHEYDFIVGTHSVISESVKYCNLGLVVTDEEHRFGVAQREKLIKKAASGAHTITMSATPIPRTIADVMFGEEKKVCTINQMPSGRLPVQTAINHSTKTIFEFIKRQLSLQHQAYIVCPLIHEEDTEDETSVSDSELSNVQAAFSLYKEEFEPLGYQVGMVNGKMDKDEIFQIINDFRENRIQILVSTTVIEVGVNVPNANVIVINNAERFGLAQLHQLRGRVGRGSSKSYCILNSNEKDNPRLNILLDSANGFDVAKEDSKLRGYGDLLGTKQSGNNRYISLILRMPHLYEKIKLYASWMNQTHMGRALLSLYEEGEINETI